MNHKPWGIGIASLGSLLALGCASEGMHYEGMASVDLDLDRTEAEVSRHHGVVMQATDSGHVVSESQRHDERMGELMDHMGESVTGMGHCSSASMGELQMMMRNVGDEVGRHHDTLDATRPVEVLREACTVYVDNVMSMLDSMRSTMHNGSCMN